MKIDFNSFVHYTYLSLTKLRFTDYKSLSRAISRAQGRVASQRRT